MIYRNGFAEPSTIRTTSGATVIERPRVRNANAVGFASQVLGKGVARTHALEALVICSFLRGLSGASPPTLRSRQRAFVGGGSLTSVS